MTLITVLIIAAICIYIFTKTNFPIAFKLFYAYIFSYACTIAYDYNHHPSIPLLQDKFEFHTMLASGHVVGFFFIAVVLLFLREFEELFNVDKVVDSAIIALVTLDALWILGGGKSPMTGDTFDGAIIAMLFPMLTTISGRIRYAIGIAWALAILVHGGSTAWFVLIAQSLACGILKKNPRIMATSCIFILIGWVTQGANFFKSDGRLLMWAKYVDWWLVNANVWLGTGPGTFEWIGPLIKLDHTQLNFFWMHNDFLQVGFEYGVVGLGLFIYAYLQHLWLCRNSVVVFTISLGAGVCMFFYSPLHLLPVALYMVFITGRYYGDA